MICGIGPIICGGGGTGRSYLGGLLLDVERGTRIRGYSRCRIFIDIIQIDHLMSVFPVLCYFICEYWEVSVGM